MSISGVLGGGKNSSKSKTNQLTDTNTYNSGTATPNNLPALQQGWNIADQLVSGTAPQGTSLAQTGLNLTGTGANAASGAATSGLNTALQFGNGGTANDANQYLTPFADGSMSGSNPNFQTILDQFARNTQAATDGSFAASGRYGSGANANAFNSAVANEAGQLGYQNYSDSLNRQLQAGQQLSTNNANATGQSITALDLINGLGTTAVGAGAADLAAGNSPALTYAQILQMLGAGGGAATNVGTTNVNNRSTTSNVGKNFYGQVSGTYGTAGGMGGGG